MVLELPLWLILPPHFLLLKFEILIDIVMVHYMYDKLITVVYNGFKNIIIFRKTI